MINRVKETWRKIVERCGGAESWGRVGEQTWRHENSLVKKYSKCGRFEYVILLVVAVVLYVIGGTFFSVGGLGSGFSVERLFCWIAALFMVAHYWYLSPQLAVAVASERDSGIFQILETTPQGCSKILILKLLAFAKPHCQFVLMFVGGFSLLNLFGNSVGWLTLAAGAAIMMFSICLALGVGLFWGVSSCDSPTARLAEVRNFAAFFIFAALLGQVIERFSQLEIFLLWFSLSLAVWGAKFKVVPRLVTLAAALTIILVSLPAQVHESKIPVWGAVSPFALAPSGIGALDYHSFEYFESFRWWKPVLEKVSEQHYGVETEEAQGKLEYDRPGMLDKYKDSSNLRRLYPTLPESQQFYIRQQVCGQVLQYLAIFGIFSVIMLGVAFLCVRSSLTGGIYDS